jgi:hypothetical protein
MNTTTVLNVRVDDLDLQFIEDLKESYAHADLEIKVQTPPDAAFAYEEAHFWQAIDLLGWEQEADGLAVIRPVVDFLAAGTLAHLYRFADVLSQKLWQLDTRAHAQPLRMASEGYLSVDDFLYARCAVVANGQSFFEGVLANPATFPADASFEYLLSVVPLAYQKKTNKITPIVSAYNYETYSNHAGWQK